MLHYGHHHFHILRFGDLGALNLSSTLRNIANGLFTILVTIYLYRLGYDLTSILFFLVICQLIWMLLIYPAMRIINRIGTTWAISISMLGNIAFALLLLTLPDYGWPLWVIAAAWAFFVSLFWPAFRLSFAESLKNHRAGRNVGFATALLVLASGIAPAIGGTIATLAGIDVVYIISVLLFATAGLVLLRKVPPVKQEPFKLEWRVLKRSFSDYVANFSFSIEDAILENIWPLFIFLFLPSYAGVGILSSVAVLAAIGVSLYVGKREETVGTKRYLREGLTVVSVSNLFRLIVSNAGHVFGVNALSGFGRSMALTPYMTRYYKHIQEGGMSYVFGMMIASGLGWLLPYSILLALSYFLPDREVLLVGLLLTVPTFLGVLRMR